MNRKYREGSKYRRFYDSPKTPYQRLMESDHLTMKQKSDLQKRYESLDPIKLRRQLYRKIALFRKICERNEAQKYWSSG